jgi:hypothetical protein
MRISLRGVRSTTKQSRTTSSGLLRGACTRTARSADPGARNDSERCTVGPKRPHYVHGQNDEPCKFMIVQGVGVYDWVPEGGQ